MACCLMAGVHAEPIELYKVEISNSYIAMPGQSFQPSSSFFTGGSVLEQWVDASRPFVRITNLANDPPLRLLGAQLNLSLSSSMVTATEWLEGAGLPEPTWNWNAEKNSAFFQFHRPLQPGESILMRLSTAPRPGLETEYKQNQTLFHPAIGNCIDTTAQFGVVSLFSQTSASPNPPSFGPTGEPVVPDRIDATVPLTEVLTPAEIANPDTVIITPVIVPVPEPDAIALAASAAVALAWAARRSIRRRAA